MRRIQTIESATGEIKGVLIAWGEVRLAEDYAQTLLKIQSMANATQQLLWRKIERRRSFRTMGEHRI